MAEQQSIVQSLFLIFTGAALVSTLALYARPLLQLQHHLDGHVVVHFLSQPEALGGF